MGKLLISSKSGGGNESLDLITATSSDILESKVIVDKEGKPLTGTMKNNGSLSQTLTAGQSLTIQQGYYDGGTISVQSLADMTSSGDATAAEILNGKKAYVDGNLVTGTMTNNGAVSPSALGAGGSYTIPAGYHNGSGKVTVQSLATMTASGDATAAQILSGKKAYVDGSLITGTMTNQGAKTASYTPSTSTQTYIIPAGYHNGSGKVTVAAIPSSYVSISGGITFFSDGAYGQFVQNVGLGKYAPGMWGSADSEGWYSFSGNAGDKSAIDPTIITTTMKFAGETTVVFCPFTYYWSTRKTLNFDNISRLTIDVWTGSSSLKVRWWFYSVSRQRCKIFDIATLSTTLDLSSVNGDCVFGCYKIDGSGQHYISSLIFS